MLQEAVPSDDRPGPPTGLQTKFMSAVIAAIAVAAIYFGKPVLMPIALAVLLAFAFGPVVGLLRRLYFGHTLSVIVTVFMAVVIVAGLGIFVAHQVRALAVELPQYQSNLNQKIRSIRGSASDDIVTRVTQVFTNLGNQLAPPQRTARTITRAPANKPIVVEVHEPEPTPLEVVKNVLGSLIEPLAIAGIVLVFVIFMLLQKEDLRDRFIRLVGVRDLQRTTVALDDGAARLSRYLLAQITINACFGIVIATGLYFIGVPNPGLWGLIGMLFRFVPYVGVPLAAIFPLALALAVDPGWSSVLWTLALFFVTEPILGQVVEPWIYGRSMGLSPVAVVVSATFWTWLWGPVGLLLAVPLTMCLVVIGRHVEGLKFLDVLLGNKPALAAEESLYLRLLAGDPDGAANQADPFFKDKPLVAWYDTVVLRALAIAQEDVNRGALDDEKQQNIRDTVAGLIENLSDRDETGALMPLAERKAANDAAVAATAAQTATPSSVPAPAGNPPVLCVSARGPLDEAAGLLLADMLFRKGIRSRMIAREDASSARLHEIDPEGVKVYCVSYLEPSSYNDARYLLRRLAKRLPGAHEISGFWYFTNQDTRYLDAIEATKSDVVTNISDAAARIVPLVNGAAAPVPASEPSPPKPVATPAAA
jgi:predicted PurR-regulated permease PerM